MFVFWTESTTLLKLLREVEYTTSVPYTFGYCYCYIGFEGIEKSGQCAWSYD
jgi:hypothetical protein